MSRIFSLLGIVIAMAIGVYFYSQQMKTIVPGAATGPASPRATVDVVGVKNDLLSFANAEKQQFALEGKYLNFDELRAKGTNLPQNRRGPYTYSADISDTGFRITATYGGPEMAGVPQSLSIDDSMQIQQQ